MQIMAEKGLVRRDEENRAHVYEASRPREWTQRQLAGDLLERAFGGSASEMMVGALAARKATKKELAEIRQLLDQWRRGDELAGYSDCGCAGPRAGAFHLGGRVIAALLAVMLRALRGASAHSRYLAACAAMAAMAASFVVTAIGTGPGETHFVAPVAVSASPDPAPASGAGLGAPPRPWLRGRRRSGWLVWRGWS